MNVFIKLYDVIGQILNMKMNIYGYHISFMNIFAFIIISGVSALFLKRLLD